MSTVVSGQISDEKRMWRILSGGVSGDPGNEWINRDPPFGVGQEIPHGPRPDVGNAARGLGSGFSSMETPIIVFDSSKATRAPLDVEAAKARDCWLVSDRTKKLFEAIDPEAFVFVQAVTRTRRNKYEIEGPMYWLCDVVRFLDAIDDAKTRMYVEQYPNNVKRISGIKINSEIFRPDVVGRCQVFRSMHAPRTVYCSDALKVAIESSGLMGFRFELGGRIDG